MNAPKFTPGPWRWDHGYTNDVAEPTWSLIGRAGYGILSCDEANAPQNCTAADADLIAAAPELYEALSEALWMIEQHEGTSDANDRIVDAARAALAKAAP